MAARIDGVDISHWQSGALDFKKAKSSGVKFVYHKATEGSGYKDPMYDRRRKEVKAASIPFGAYHFARPTKGSAKREAEFFYNYAKPVPGDMIPMLDLEVNTGNLNVSEMTTWVSEFIDYFKSKDLDVVIYTHYTLNNTFNLALWVARYSNAMSAPRVPAPWKKYDIWQFSNGQYGSPRSVPGLGNVDINTFNTGVTVDKFLIKEKTKPVPVEEIKLKIWHFSMQFSDSPAQHKKDAKTAFTQDADVVTGTEGGPGAESLGAALRAEAKANGYHLYLPATKTDCWVAVKKTIAPKGIKTGFKELHPFAKSIKDPHPYSSRGIVWATFSHPSLGTITVGSVHLLTLGRYMGQSKADNKKCPIDHYTVNKKMGTAITAWAKKKGEKRKLVFVTGDTNLVDKTTDVFNSGGALVTCWDDLKKGPNTGHGNIDVIARYRGDARVKIKNARVYTDKDLPMHTDHFPVKAVYTIRK